MRISFLTSHLAPYFVAGLKCCQRDHGAVVQLFHWASSTQFPYSSVNEIGITKLRHEKDDELFADVMSFAPDVIFVAGWRDRGYMRVARHHKSRGIPVVVGIDNPWTGNFRQRLACFGARGWLSRHFSHAWTPGLSQYNFANRLGFRPRQILDGLYSADHALSTDLSTTTKARQQLLFVGRLVPEKNILALVNEFLALAEKVGSGWELVVIGEGPEKERLPRNPRVRCLGFQPPASVQSAIQNSDACILPSLYEPWGVAVHEYAVAGKPILVSNQCGAAERLLVDGFNGFAFDGRSHASIRSTLERLFQTSPEELQAMGRNSRKLANFNSPELWAQRLTNLARR